MLSQTKLMVFAESSPAILGFDVIPSEFEAEGAVMVCAKPISLLDVARDWTSGNHTVEGWLLNATSGIDGKRVKITVNGTEYLSSVTNASGYFKLSLSLKSVNNNATTYAITASFEDTAQQPINVTAWAQTLDGRQYPACTTVQYGYKPAFNSTTLTVWPQSTELLLTNKSPEEMQEQAEQSGWFKVEPEFSWWYPWFRLHYKLDVNLPQGNPKLDYGWSPLPYGDSSEANSTALARIINDTTEGSDPEALAMFFAAIAVPFIIQATVCYSLGYGPWAIGIAALVYGIFLAGYTVSTYLSASGNPRALLMAFMAAAFVEAASLFLPPFSITGVACFLSTAGRLVLREIQHPLQALHALRMGFFAITTAIFALMDFVVMVFFLSMYLKSILV